MAINEATTTSFVVPLSEGEASTTPTSYEEITTVNSYIKSGWREIESSKVLASADGLIQTAVPSKWFGLFEFFKQIGLEIGNGFIKIANLVTDKIIANKVQTKELCIDEVCVTKDQLAAMIANAGITPASTPDIIPDDTASTTPPIIEEPTPSTGSGQVATTTPPVIEEPVATTTPEITPPDPLLQQEGGLGTPSPDQGEGQGGVVPEIIPPTPTPAEIPVVSTSDTTPTTP